MHQTKYRPSNIQQQQQKNIVFYINVRVEFIIIAIRFCLKVIQILKFNYLFSLFWLFAGPWNHLYNIIHPIHRQFTIFYAQITRNKSKKIKEKDEEEGKVIEANKQQNATFLYQMK